MKNRYDINKEIQSIILFYFLYFQSLKVEKKSSAGIKRKAPEVMDKSHKDHESKRQKLREAKTKPAKLEPIRITIKKSRLLEW